MPIRIYWRGYFACTGCSGYSDVGLASTGYSGYSVALGEPGGAATWPILAQVADGPKAARRKMPLWDSPAMFCRILSACTRPREARLLAGARHLRERACRSRSPGKTKDAKDGAASGEPERTADGPLEAPEGHGAEASARPEPTEQAEDTAVDPDAQAAN